MFIKLILKRLSDMKSIYDKEKIDIDFSQNN